MSRIIAQAAIRGAHGYVEQAEKQLSEAIGAYGPEKKVEFPNTAYFLPLILALTGLEVRALSDTKAALARARELLPLCPRTRAGSPISGRPWTPGSPPSSPKK